MKATYREHTQRVGYQEVHLNPGEFVFGIKMAQAELGLSYQTVRTCVRTLEKSGNLTIKSTNKFSVISVVNWGLYQDTDSYANNQINSQLTINQQTTNKQLTTNKNDKKDNNGENDKNIYTASTQTAPDSASASVDREQLPQDAQQKRRVRKSKPDTPAPREPLGVDAFSEFDKPDEAHRAWTDFVAYKIAAFGKGYKTEMSERAAIANLRKDSGNDSGLAREIVMQSIRKEWKGLFPLRVENEAKGSNSGGNGNGNGKAWVNPKTGMTEEQEREFAVKHGIGVERVAMYVEMAEWGKKKQAQIDRGEKSMWDMGAM